MNLRLSFFSRLFIKNVALFRSNGHRLDFSFTGSSGDRQCSLHSTLIGYKQKQCLNRHFVEITERLTVIVNIIKILSAYGHYAIRVVKSLNLRNTHNCVQRSLCVAALFITQTPMIPHRYNDHHTMVSHRVRIIIMMWHHGTGLLHTTHNHTQHITTHNTQP